jgi:hypothetical protein
MSPLDRYLLDGSPSKGDVIAGLLASPAATEAAAPFLRVLDLLGTRVPDDTLIGLRLALTGEQPSDEDFRVMRDLVTRARSGDADARTAYLARFETVA